MQPDSFEIVDDGRGSASLQMERDQALIDSLSERKRPCLRFYEWEKPTVTYGYFIDPEKHFEKHLRIDSTRFDFARRPTGGGILFHVDDFPFSVAVPACHPCYSENILENYHLINDIVLHAVQETFSKELLSLEEKKEGRGVFQEFCMASPTKYDLLLDGAKIGGSAQRKTKYGFVHQGSIFLAMPCWDMIDEVFHGDKEIIASMKATSRGLCGSPSQPNMRKELMQALIKGFSLAFS